jgi:mannose-1-phosphate guanylyltransferase
MGNRTGWRQGVWLRSLVRAISGDEQPKVIVTCRAHGAYTAQEFDGMPHHRVLVQPEDRGTAAGVLFPAHWIHSQDTDTVVAVFPPDHFILEGTAFMSHIANTVEF